MKAKTQSRPFPVAAAFIAGCVGMLVFELKWILWNHQPQPAIGQIATDLLVAVVAAFGYVLIWSKINTLRNWIVGGVVLGIVVFVCVTAVSHGPWPLVDRLAFDRLIGYTVFFGLPVAWYVARSMRAAS